MTVVSTRKFTTQVARWVLRLEHQRGLVTATYYTQPLKAQHIDQSQSISYRSHPPGYLEFRAQSTVLESALAPNARLLLAPPVREQH